ncbi:MAG: hypothetical protein C4522_06160 [Desulfobacteraceae bacterium]|nr:MAG: hypothetical protein C4522_06160 [Desulfobacteraceae bacterium]
MIRSASDMVDTFPAVCKSQQDALFKEESLMGFLSLFTGKSPEQIEEKADSLFHDGEYGPAKIEYEKALARLEKQPDPDPESKRRMEEKRVQCKEQLASNHLHHAKELIESDCRNDAAELLQLALELTADEKLTARIREALNRLADAKPRTENEYADPTEEDAPWEDDEYFTALVNPLSPAEQDAYLGYGKEFKTGFIALNQGDFKTAVQNLTAALKTHSSQKTFIPLELATAHLNQGDYGRAESLLTGFLKDFPESVRAYQLLCEILWENQKFQDAEALIRTCPEKPSQTLPIQLLLGETYFLSGDMEKAIAFYQDVLQKREWDNLVAQSLARTYEAVGRNAEARDVYGQIIGACQGCGRKIDPHVKQRYAETSFEAGDFSTKLLELYFSLTQEDPENRSHYYRKISQIYSMQGNEKEAGRFLSLAT